jgi:7-keto-8-aminopelargonate synthetase-like enzyme
MTEGLFSMDSDSPDLRAMQAALPRVPGDALVDIAHDFGSLGPGGTATSAARGCSAR